MHYERQRGSARVLQSQSLLQKSKTAQLKINVLRISWITSISYKRVEILISNRCKPAGFKLPSWQFFKPISI